MGATLSLPLLEAMIPAATAANRVAQPAKRLSYIYIPMGTDHSRWNLGATSTLEQHSTILKSLEPVRQHCTVVSNPELEPAHPGTNATSNASVLSDGRGKKPESRCILYQ